MENIMVGVSFLMSILVLKNISEIGYTRKFFLQAFLGLILVEIMMIISEPLANVAMGFVFIYIVYSQIKKIVRSGLVVIFTMIVLFVSTNTFFYFLLLLKIEGLMATEDIRSNLFVYVVTTVIVGVLAVAIAYIIKKIVNKFVKVAFANRVSIIMLGTMILIFIILFMNAFWVSEVKELRTASMVINLVLIMVFAIEAYVIMRMNKAEYYKEQKEIELKQLEEYTANIEAFYNEMRQFKHDYTNILASMVGYMQADDMQGLIGYYERTIEPFNLSIEYDKFRLGALAYLKVIELKGIIATKVIKAREQGIHVEIEMKELVDKIDMDIVDLSRCVGIIVDNAIEAALECEEPRVTIAIMREENEIIIKVVNSVRDKVIDINKMFQKGISTKGIDRGIGLYNYREITSKYDNVFDDTVISGNVLAHSILITNKEYEKVC